MATLKALTTLALERGKVAPGQVFQLHSAENAKELVEAGLAEVSEDEVKDEALDVAPDTERLSIASPKPAPKPKKTDAE